MQASEDGENGRVQAASDDKVLPFNGCHVATLALLVICWEQSAQRPGYRGEGTVATGQHPLLGWAGNASSALRVRMPNLLPRTTRA